MEKRDLYDRNRNLTGQTIYKNEKIPEGKYIIVVLVIIQNSKGEFLVQKRSKQKDGLYGFTGGHAKSGETGLEGMITEIEEELSLKIKEEELDLLFSGREDKYQVFFDLFYLKKDIDISKLVLQEDEVEFVKWCTLEEIKELINNGVFLENHAEEIFRTIDILKKRGINILN